MPEIPDLESYVAALRPRIAGVRLESVRLKNPFLLRTVDPPLEDALNREVKRRAPLPEADPDRTRR